MRTVNKCKSCICQFLFGWLINNVSCTSEESSCIGIQSDGCTLHEGSLSGPGSSWCGVSPATAMPVVSGHCKPACIFTEHGDPACWSPWHCHESATLAAVSLFYHRFPYFSCLGRTLRTFLPRHSFQGHGSFCGTDSPWFSKVSVQNQASEIPQCSHEGWDSQERAMKA